MQCCTCECIRSGALPLPSLCLWQFVCSLVFPSGLCNLCLDYLFCSRLCSLVILMCTVYPCCLCSRIPTCHLVHQTDWKSVAKSYSVPHPACLRVKMHLGQPFPICCSANPNNLSLKPSNSMHLSSLSPHMLIYRALVAMVAADGKGTAANYQPCQRGKQWSTAVRGRFVWHMEKPASWYIEIRHLMIK